jgi:hypothetical protein
MRRRSYIYEDAIKIIFICTIVAPHPCAARQLSLDYLVARLQWDRCNGDRSSAVLQDYK